MEEKKEIEEERKEGAEEEKEKRVGRRAGWGRVGGSKKWRERGVSWIGYGWREKIGVVGE